MKFRRRLCISLPKDQSAFLFGPRQCGKSSFLREHFPKALFYDLLKSDLYLELLKNPAQLREELIAIKSKQQKLPLIVIDEVQKIPILLDEVHWCIENLKAQFILCGSSARKLKREGANLLGGRAWRFNMYPLSYFEIKEVDLIKIFQQGLLPRHYLAEQQYQKNLKAYVNDYLTEEIKAEGLVKNLRTFAKFLDAAIYSHAQLVNYNKIANDCGIDSKTVKEYFEILEDTLLCYQLYPFQNKKDRKKLGNRPKFYFFDPGLSNFIAKEKLITLKSYAAGISFESYILHELMAYRAYSELDFSIEYWRNSSGLEVDFVLANGEVLIEVKSSSKVRSSELKGLKALRDSTNTKRNLVVCLEKRARNIVNEDKNSIEILPVQNFLEELWAKRIL